MKNVVFGLLKINTSFGFNIFISLLMFSTFSPSCSEQDSIEKMLRQKAKDMNESCPVYVDSETRLDNVDVHAGKVVKYNYTLVNISKSDIDINEFKVYFEQILLNGAKTRPDLKMFRDNRVTMIYSYNDKNGLLLIEVKITPDKYEN